MDKATKATPATKGAVNMPFPDTAVAVATAVALAAVVLEVLPELASAALAQAKWRTAATSTLALEDAVSLATAFTTTASVARITRITRQPPGRILAPTEWQADPEVTSAGLRCLNGLTWENWRIADASSTG